jgi:glycosyltransferase involved in cell wall biosynthesis
VNVVLVPSWYSSDRAPSRGSFVRDQAVALARRGHRVTMVAFDRDARSRPLQIARGIEDGLPHVRIAVPAPWHRLLGFYAPDILARRLRTVLREERPDIVHAHAVRPAGVVVARSLAGMPVPWCLTEHSSPLTAFWWTPHGHRQIDRAYRSAARLFGVSNSLVDEMKRCFPQGAKHATLLYNGIDTDIFVPARDRAPAGARLLFVGGLVPQKGVSDLLRAVAALPRALGWTLSLAGAGPLEAALRSEAEALGIADRLRWLGAVPHRAMPALYADHDLLVVASHAETFSLVGAEALACGIPVVATLCGGPEEVIGQLGLPLVPPGDPAALARAILAMIDRLPAFDREGAVRSIAERFSMSALAARLEGHYAQMVREPE